MGQSLLLRFLAVCRLVLRYSARRCLRDGLKMLAIASSDDSVLVPSVTTSGIVTGDAEDCALFCRERRPAWISHGESLSGVVSDGSGEDWARRILARSRARRDLSIAMSISWRRKLNAVLRSAGRASAADVSPERYRSKACRIADMQAGDVERADSIRAMKRA